MGYLTNRAPLVRPFLIVGLLLGMLLGSSCKSSKGGEVTPDDEVYHLTVPVYYGSYVIPSDNALTKSGVNLGRHLFYEKALSLDNSISCGSCHVQKHAFSDPNRFSVGVDGVLGTRNAMSLSNLLWQRNFFWDGRASTLEAQVPMPIVNVHEMQETLDHVVSKLAKNPLYPPLFRLAFGDTAINSDRIAKAIAQFERTLISADATYDQYLKGKYKASASELNGMNLFFVHPDPTTNLRGANCGDCHSGNLTYSFDFRNNGLDSSVNVADLGLEGITFNLKDKRKFKVPSLRNIALTAPYMHDGRFATLEEVVDHYDEHVQKSTTLDPLIINATNVYQGTSLMLTAQEKADLVAFLKMLTDSSFVNNPEFSDPFQK